MRGTFDAPALRKRLELPAIEYVEYDRRVAGSDATWSCKPCRCVIMRMHPAYENASVALIPDGDAGLAVELLAAHDVAAATSAS